MKRKCLYGMIVRNTVGKGVTGEEIGLLIGEIVRIISTTRTIYVVSQYGKKKTIAIPTTALTINITQDTKKYIHTMNKTFLNNC